MKATISKLQQQIKELKSEITDLKKTNRKYLSHCSKNYGLFLKSELKRVSLESQIENLKKQN